MLEIALGSGIFVALFSGTIQYGYTIYTFNNLESAVRAGARYGSITVYDTRGEMVSDNGSTTYSQAIQNVTVYGTPAGASSGNSPVAYGLRPEHVRVSVAFSGGSPSLVTVRSAVFGSITKFTEGDVAQFAASLAKELLAQHYARAGRSPTGRELKSDTTGLSKPGWFEPGDAVVFSTTVF